MFQKKISVLLQKYVSRIKNNEISVQINEIVSDLSKGSVSYAKVSTLAASVLDNPACGILPNDVKKILKLLTTFVTLPTASQLAKFAAMFVLKPIICGVLGFIVGLIIAIVSYESLGIVSLLILIAIMSAGIYFGREWRWSI
jgi:hypothetical protein